MWTYVPPIMIANFFSSNEKVAIASPIVGGSNCNNAQLIIAISATIFELSTQI